MSRNQKRTENVIAEVPRRRKNTEILFSKDYIKFRCSYIFGYAIRNMCTRIMCPFPAFLVMGSLHTNLDSVNLLVQ